VDTTHESISLKKEQKPFIVHDSNLWKRAFFSWAFPLIKLAKEKQLSADDLGGLREQDQVQRKLSLMRKNYYNQKKRKEKFDQSYYKDLQKRIQSFIYDWYLLMPHGHAFPIHHLESHPVP